MCLVKLIVTILVLMTLTSGSYAIESSFEIIPLNSPVKDALAKFLIKVSNDNKIEDVSVRIKNANHLFEKDKPYKKMNVVDVKGGKELHIQVSSLPPGFYQVFVKLKSHKKIEYSNKNKYKNYVRLIIEGANKVAAPDERENNRTVKGVDSDNDGIRDDIQRWIDEEFSSQPDVRLGMRQIAIANQLELLTVANREQSIIASRKLLDSINCLGSIVGTDAATKYQREHDAKLLNTKDRLNANIKSNSNFSGQAYELKNSKEEERALCDFDVMIP